MTTLNEQFQALQAAGADLTAARSRHTLASNQLWATLRPVVGQHQKSIGDLFESAGLSEQYEQRFGATRGERLASISVSGGNVEIGLVAYFRGEAEDVEFRLPLAYLHESPEIVLARDVIHFRKVFDRLDRMRQHHDEADTREENLRELARLAELLKGDPDAVAALAVINKT